MTSIVKVFESADIRFVDHPEGKYGFGIMADDLAIVLDASSGTNLARSTEEEWKGSHIVSTLGGNQSTIVIWEPGIYELLSKSRKPKAKPFKKWLFEEVLPSIRKTGSYSVGDQPARALPQRDTIDYIKAAAILPNLKVNDQLKALLEDALTDDLELMRNQRLLGSGKKEYTIVKVRAKELGYFHEQIKNGSGLGRFVASIVPAAFAKRIGDYDVKHYEVTPALDEAIRAYFR